MFSSPAPYDHRASTRIATEVLVAKGLDMLFIGAADLSCSYGLPHQVTHPTVRAASKRIFERAARGGMKVGVPAYDAKQALEVAELGAGYITSPAVDTYHLPPDADAQGASAGSEGGIQTLRRRRAWPNKI
jgi:2-keto-3-deoxy-L-rhamnonate aldolase RhmA